MGADAQRSFPTIDIIALVKRRQEYYQVNAALPFSAFSLLSLLQFAVQPLQHYTGDFDITGINHRSQLSLMLVLTASAYKMAISGRLPGISCECPPCPPWQAPALSTNAAHLSRHSFGCLRWQT